MIEAAAGAGVGVVVDVEPPPQAASVSETRIENKTERLLAGRKAQCVAFGRIQDLASNVNGRVEVDRASAGSLATMPPRHCREARSTKSSDKPARPMVSGGMFQPLAFLPSSSGGQVRFPRAGNTHRMIATLITQRNCQKH